MIIVSDVLINGLVMNTTIYQKKLNEATRVVEGLKDSLMVIIWEEDPFEFCSSRALLPFIQEEAEYNVRSLGLSKQDQEHFIEKVKQVLGEFCEM